MMDFDDREPDDADEDARRFADDDQTGDLWELPTEDAPIDSLDVPDQPGTPQ